MSKYIPKLTGEKVYLSPMFTDDAEQYARWMNNIEVTRYLGQASKCYSLDSEKKALERMVSEGHNYAMVLKEEDRLIGNISLMDVNYLYQTAELGIFIGEVADRGNGYGQEAIRLLIDYGFRFLNLKNIMLRVYSGNKQAIHVYEKCGFKPFGKRTKCLFVDDKWHDEIFMEILKEGQN